MRAKKNAMSFHGLGVTEHSQGTFTVMLIADLAMITGNIGRRGVGGIPCVDRITFRVLRIWDVSLIREQVIWIWKILKWFQKYELFYKSPFPKEIGYKIPEMYDASLNDRLKAVWIIGEDLVQTDPNTHHVKKALEKLDLLIVQELFMSETAKMAHVILPGASFLEKSGTFTNGERRIQRVNKVVDPVGNTKADGQIIVDLMNKMGYPEPDYDPAVQLKEISGIVPFFKGVKWEELGINGKQWPVLEDGSDTEILHLDTFKKRKR